MSLSRRRFAMGATAFGNLGCHGLSRYGSALAAAPSPSEWAMDAPLMTLKDAAASSGILVGCAVDAARLRDSIDYATLVHSQANIIVAENAFKFGLLRPTTHSFNFHDADTVADFAHTYGMKLRGHNFVWHRQLPTWFGTYVTSQNAEQVMVEHITKVGSRYSGGVHSWDVVNEAILLEDGRPGRAAGLAMVEADGTGVHRYGIPDGAQG